MHLRARAILGGQHKPTHDIRRTTHTHARYSEDNTHARTILGGQGKREKYRVVRVSRVRVYLPTPLSLDNKHPPALLGQNIPTRDTRRTTHTHARYSEDNKHPRAIFGGQHRRTHDTRRTREKREVPSSPRLARGCVFAHSLDSRQE